MGYTTNFEGSLLFKDEPTASQLAYMKQFFGEDVRDHPEWNSVNSGISYLDLEFNHDLTGIRHDGAEKTYDFEKIVALFIKLVQVEYPDFGLTGSLLAQGEEIDDRWGLTIDEHGNPAKVPIAFKGKKITCPHCDESFLLEESSK